MIIFGFRTTSSLLGVDEFACPTCGEGQRCRIYREQRWFTLYFIPLIPLGGSSQRVDCLSCGGAYPGEVLIGPAPFRAELAEDPALAKGPELVKGPSLVKGPELEVPRNSPTAITSLILDVSRDGLPERVLS